MWVSCSHTMWIKVYLLDINIPGILFLFQDTNNKMDKVFFTNITRTYNKSNEDLYELLKVDPAIPVPINPVKTHSCDFRPRNDKQYIPKRKNKLKVNTVRDIRNLYEKDVMSELPSELEKQQNLLLRKIKGGTSKDEKTKLLAKNMLNSNKPMTRSSWQMLMNINHEGHTHSMQYVLWNGNPIRVNGSKGGKNKFICNYDLGKRREPFKNASSTKVFKKKGLLRNSLSVNFKPGPLTRKKYLDNSYQKYHVGNIEVVNLPTSGLEIQPLYGSALDPTICNFVNSLRDENGTITEKWAEFAVSVVGSLKGPNIRQLSDKNSVTFDLNYQHNQKRLLMRRDQSNNNEFKKNRDSTDLTSNDKNDSDIKSEVRVVMNRILDAVEINLIQDSLFMEDDERRDQCHSDTIQNNNKEKLKRKYCELDRLAVTVIRLSENSLINDDKKCQNSYCALGCICSSLQSNINLKGHCGRFDCMFKCKCNFSNYKCIEGLDNDCPDLLPGLLNLNNRINCTLAKEEQKFHQTVILTGDKSILLKSKKRNTKSSKKYAEFFSSISLKSESKTKTPVLAIVEPRLDCDNIEPMCMVHNLYKCFCRGRFTECYISKEKEIIATETIKELENADSCEKINNDYLEPSKKEKEIVCDSNRYQTRTRTIKNNVLSQSIDTIDLDDENDSCSRVKPYVGRKYSNGYYRNAYSKILDMEIHDTTLRKKLLYLTAKSIKHTTDSNLSSDFLSNDGTSIENNNVQCQEVQVANPVSIDSPSTPRSESDSVQDTGPTKTTNRTKLKLVDSSSTKRLLNKPKLVAWLESSYQQYKRRLDLGYFRSSLEAPKKGKVALYPWDFILRRYSERKNLFLVTKEAPFRIFMAVNATNPLFENCINIDDIRFADLNKYPTSVKNLLTNTSDLRDYFCILFGLNSCWEFIGSVTKVGDPKDAHLEDEVLETGMTQESDEIPGYDSDSRSDSVQIEDIDQLSDKKSEENVELLNPEKSTEQLKSELSKWFIMTIENDFTEIQFYNRGFFVMYASIIQAINVARTSGKTVRLSPQKLADNNGPQFGIYAVPNANDYCVFVGPYEIEEPLGIETIKNTFIRKAKRTRGVWITTGKVDNIKVIDNPLSFIPTQKDMVLLESDSVGSKNSIQETDESNNEKTKTNLQGSQDVNDKNKTKETVKVVKPIKIRKTNGFYHLTQKSLPKSFKLAQTVNQNNAEPTPTKIQPSNIDVSEMAAALDAMPVIIAGCDTLNVNDVPLLIPISRVTNIQVLKHAKPVAEVAPQIKITDVYSEANLERPVAEVAPQIKIADVYSEASLEKPVAEVAPQIKISDVYSEASLERPVAEVAPQIKIADVYSEVIPEKQAVVKKKEGSMVILKPEEINKRIENKLNSTAPSQMPILIDDHNDTMDVEYFLDNSDICPAPVNFEEEKVTEDICKAVYIECKNVNLGAIRGTQNKNDFVSFDFPGFKSSDFYEPDEVFTKINQ